MLLIATLVKSQTLYARQHLHHRSRSAGERGSGGEGVFCVGQSFFINQGAYLSGDPVEMGMALNQLREGSAVGQALTVTVNPLAQCAAVIA